MQSVALVLVWFVFSACVGLAYARGVSVGYQRAEQDSAARRRRLTHGDDLSVEYRLPEAQHHRQG